VAARSSLAASIVRGVSRGKVVVVYPTHARRARMNGPPAFYSHPPDELTQSDFTLLTSGCRQYRKISDMVKLARYWIAVPCIISFLLQARPQSPLAKNLDVIRRNVVFIYTRDAQGIEQPDGTGFLLAIPEKGNPAVSYLVLVTARHMADPAWLNCVPSSELTVHFNKKEFDPSKDDSGVVELSLKGQQWIYPDDESIDIAFTFIDGKKFDSLNSENGGLPISQLPSANEAKTVEIGAWIASAGLLPGVPGAKRNYPVFKFGNVSSIPQEKIPVPGCAGTNRLMTEWLIAVSLVGGNSGSPIVRMPTLGDAGRPFLLGVQSISVAGTDVAGMAPIRYLVEKLRGLQIPNLDLSIAGDAEDVKPTATSAQPQIKVTTVSSPNWKP